MKSKKILMVLISILTIIVLSVTAFATESTSTTNSTNSSVQNTVEEKLIPALEEKLKEKENQKQENNVITNEITTGILDKASEDEEKDLNSDKISAITYENVISEDVVNCEEEVKYKNYEIDGNVFILSSKVKIENTKINGDVFVISDNVELDNVEVSGSIYTSGATVKMNVKAGSIYGVSENISISKESEISKELRLCGKIIEVAGVIGRDAYIYASELEILDETKISGDCIVKAEKSTISEDATIKGETDVEIISTNAVQFVVSGKYHLIEIGVEFAIILVVSLFILGGFPKFAEVNKKLRVRDFFKAFFTGILDIVVIIAIAVGLFITGHGIGYGFALILLTFIMLGLGKLIFILAFAIRISGKSEKVSKPKIFIMTIIVALIIEAIELLSFTGAVGIIFVSIVNMIIGMSGFGTLIRVIFTSKKKLEKMNATEKTVDEETKENIKTDETQENEIQAKANEEALKEEVKKEIAEEIKEMQDEKEKEKELKKEEKSEDNKENK